MIELSLITRYYQKIVAVEPLLSKAEHSGQASFDPKQRFGHLGLLSPM